jgi:hypothetical protein
MFEKLRNFVVFWVLLMFGAVTLLFYPVTRRVSKYK